MSTAILSAVMALAPGLWALAQDAPIDRGAYLAGRVAAIHDDFIEAAPWLKQALQADPTNMSIASDALATTLGAGDRESSVALAQTITAAGHSNQLANTVLLAQAVIDSDWRRMYQQLEAGYSAGPMIDGLARAWGHLGLGETADALSAFDEMIENPPARVVAQFHKGLALAMMGDFEGANAALSQPMADGISMTGPAVLALAEIRSQLDDNAGAIAVLDDFFHDYPLPEAQELRARLVADEAVPFTRLRTPAQGVAEALYALAQVAAQSDDRFVTLLYSRLTTWIDPTHDGAQLGVARILADLGNLELAEAAYAAVPADSPNANAAAMGRALLLADHDQVEDAIPIVTDLAAANPQNPSYNAVLGGLQRSLGRNAEAVAAYSAAIDATPEGGNRWPLFFNRAVSHHQLRDWPQTEADLRAALTEAPDQPLISNYLGYLLIDRNEQLDEGLGLIQRAIAADPNNGAIVDSLGWAYFRLGRYDEAVVQLERAVTLEPVEYEINDHLGDAYWQVGRKREARFQWQRALSFATGPNAPQDMEPETIEAIRDKLHNGLQAPESVAESDG
ncbi:TPR domain protein [Ketogulonicigenium robustum]|uniref:TPR domain protein n=1 Tax=Ketogulonicigenium robustum TaxID=92947 RepID=A0A1W6NWW5_9RHOB|nr:tetratricopeptide repeat protein [Ketogulonicigenium robustum]ARO13736.1 TPR domain protein [Ketogulonicigenium robustum]